MEKPPVGSLEYAKEIVGKDPVAVHLGICVEKAETGFARCSLVVKPEYLNAVARAHGTIVHAVADQAFAVACNSMGTSGIALNMNINYISGAAEGEKITAEASPVSTSRKISVWKIPVTGENGRLIASCEGVAYHKK